MSPYFISSFTFTEQGNLLIVVKDSNGEKEKTVLITAGFLWNSELPLKELENG